jgi:hypothetical protein
MRFRRLVILTIVAAMAMVAQLALIPAAGAAGPNQQRYTVDFTIPAGQCSAIADPTLAIEGIADFFTVTTGRTVNSVATGTATDNQGGTYRFTYHNHQTITPLADGSAQVLMSDYFNLNGQGAASGLHVGFTWRITFNPDGSIGAVEQLNTRGDPIDPATFASHCDPI